MLCKIFRLAPLALSLLIPVFVAAEAHPPDVATNKAHKGIQGSPPPPLFVDQVWAGTGVQYDALSAGPVIYIGYYDAERYLTVARYDSERGDLRKKRLDNRFTGWDAHNYVTLTLDAAGRLHVAANMHVSPLVYARMTEPDDLDSLTLLNRMTGSDERHTTYPKFFRFPGGDLGFTYRSGHSGDGVELINRFDGERWRRDESTPLLAPAPGGERVNAYHTGYVPGPDGQFHMAWVWRKTPDAQTNFHVNYARSPDLRAWFDSRGRRLALPMTPAHAEVADPVPTDSGLMNNVKLGFDAEGRPIISYIKFDADGHTQLYHARAAEGGWQIAPATQWRYRWAFGGRGTLMGEISFSGVRATNDGRLIEDVSHRIYGRQQIELDATDLSGTMHPAPAGRARPGFLRPQEPYRTAGRALRQEGAGGVAGEIRWHSLGTNNNDRPRSCESSGLPPDCRMTGPLQLWVD